MPGRLVSPLLAPLLGPVVYGNGQDPFYDLDRNLFEWTPNINGVNAWGRFFNAWSPTGPNYEIDIVGFTDVVNGEQAIIAFGGTADGSAFSRDRVGNPDEFSSVRVTSPWIRRSRFNAKKLIFFLLFLRFFLFGFFGHQISHSHLIFFSTHSAVLFQCSRFAH